MAVSKKDRKRRKRRALRVSCKIKRVSQLPRVSVYRSLKHMHAQIIDDRVFKTVAGFSSTALKGVSGDKKAIAHRVGLELAKRAIELGIEKVVLDRGPFAYHGRVQALANGLREGGLKV